MRLTVSLSYNGALLLEGVKVAKDAFGHVDKQITINEQSTVNDFRNNELSNGEK